MSTGSTPGEANDKCISPGAYFWSKGLFEKFFLHGGLIFGGGGEAYIRGGGGLIHGRIFALFLVKQL